MRIQKKIKAMIDENNPIYELFLSVSLVIVSWLLFKWVRKGGIKYQSDFKGLGVAFACLLGGIVLLIKVLYKLFTAM